jgi:hypothetical protein
VPTVDVMDKPDREAVFRKAGTKALPIVFIDDKYAGDFDRLQELEEVGKLDELLVSRPERELPLEMHFESFVLIAI